MVITLATEFAAVKRLWFLIHFQRKAVSKLWKMQVWIPQSKKIVKVGCILESMNSLRLLGILALYGFFFLVGVAGLLLVFWYSGPYFILVHSYGGNLTASFACYFLSKSIVTLSAAITHKFLYHRTNLALSCLITLLVVEIFEVTDGFFAIMTNVYDPLDYGVNALGVAWAVVVDLIASQVLKRLKGQYPGESTGSS